MEWNDSSVIDMSCQIIARAMTKHKSETRNRVDNTVKKGYRSLGELFFYLFYYSLLWITIVYFII